MTMIPSIKQAGSAALLPRWETAHLRRSFRRVRLTGRTRSTQRSAPTSAGTPDGSLRTIRLVKLDEHGAAMSGARFRLATGCDERTRSVFSVPQTGWTETVELGTVYCLVEIAAPAGYAAFGKKIYFEVTPHGIEARKRRGDAFVFATWQGDYHNQVMVGGEGRMTISVMNHPSRVPLRTKRLGGAPFTIAGAPDFNAAAVACGPFLALRQRREVA